MWPEIEVHIDIIVYKNTKHEYTRNVQCTVRICVMKDIACSVECYRARLPAPTPGNDRVVAARVGFLGSVLKYILQSRKGTLPTADKAAVTPTCLP